MGSILSRIPSVDKSTFSIIATVVSGGVYFFGDRLGDTALKAIHVGAFSTWFGTQFWVTFVAGIVMFHSMPRQMFGLVQSKLFPKYFMTGVGCSSVGLASYLVLNPVEMWTGSSKTEGILLGSTLVCNCLSFFIIEPLTTSQMFKCHRYEKEHGETGHEIAKPLSEALKDDKDYLALRKTFFQLHGISSLVGLSSFATSCAYLWFFQKRIQF
eukprot:gene11903-13137_t